MAPCMKSVHCIDVSVIWGLTETAVVTWAKMLLAVSPADPVVLVVPVVEVVVLPGTSLTPVPVCVGCVP
jgi:hypothetical protein